MDPKDKDLTKGSERESRGGRRPDEQKSSDRTAAPPIEREHETQEGILEEDERRERERR
jgi:hypothetical protein